MSLHVQCVEILYGGRLTRERGFCRLFLSESVSEPLFFCLVVSLVLSVFVCFFFDERRTGMMMMMMMMGSNRYDDGGGGGGMRFVYNNNLNTT